MQDAARAFVGAITSKDLCFPLRLESGTQFLVKRILIFFFVSFDSELGSSAAFFRSFRGLYLEIHKKSIRSLGGTRNSFFLLFI